MELQIPKPPNKVYNPKGEATMMVTVDDVSAICRALHDAHVACMRRKFMSEAKRIKATWDKAEEMRKSKHWKK